MRVAGSFPTNQRPERRPITDSVDDEINAWFEGSKIIIGKLADTQARVQVVKRLLYT